ncbi:hypothetical protein DIURU_001771 [Diutina rugosa]|uniref:UBA domain-containing protein n=1 Tax=Diutina rugosa TaxID=5481 RepID=A0A642UT78_DIURU|nr:uncharacterized protein DIURU_001771 [Diutina rugosa]KAA8904935.1 hypothetical protein DIURU_001771 [Diutina rugosa]
MINDELISSIVSMGFSAEEAQKALEQSNNDVEIAIAFLLGDHDEGNDPPPPTDDHTHQAPPPPLPDRYHYDDLVPISNPEDIPNFPPRESGVRSIIDNEDYYPKPETSPLSTVVIPTVTGLLDNHMLPFLSIMSQLDRFQQALMVAPGGVPEYTSRWYNSPITITPTEQYEKQSQVAAAKFVTILQLISAVAGPSSVAERAFITNKVLVTNYPPDFCRELGLIEEVDDCYVKFVTSLDNNIQHLTGKSSKIDQLFLSTVESITDNRSNPLGLFSIEGESRRGNLYDSMTQLFWSEPDSVGSIRLSQCAPVMGFQLGEANPGTEPFSLDEYFYPDIYSRKCADRFKSVYTKQQELKQYRSSLEAPIIDVTAFGGRSILGMLDQTKEYLQETYGDGDHKTELDDINQLRDNVSNRRNQLLQSVEEVTKELKGLNFYHRDVLLSHVEGVALEEYLLIGVVFSDSEYFYRQKTLSNEDENWVHINVSSTSSGRVIDFDVKLLSFDAMHTYVLERTRDPYVSMWLYYASQESFNEKVAVTVPPPITQFISRDNLEIERIREDYNSSDEPTAEESNEEPEVLDDDDHDADDDDDDETYRTTS